MAVSNDMKIHHVANRMRNTPLDGFNPDPKKCVFAELAGAMF
jgi:hypothetical protein